MREVGGGEDLDGVVSSALSLSSAPAGSSLTDRIVTVALAVPVSSPAPPSVPSPSTRVKLIVRAEVAGFSLVLSYWTARITSCTRAGVALALSTIWKPCWPPLE